MTRLTGVLGGIVFVLVGCSSVDYAQSPAGQCLLDAGWVQFEGEGGMFEKNGEYLHLREDDGMVFPLGDDDLEMFVAAGCGAVPAR
jgi:hypothetical protein